MDWVLRAWEWLSGKKTVIGSIALWLAYTGIPFIVGLGFDPAWLNTVVSILAWLGGILTPTGILHKITKRKKA